MGLAALKIASAKLEYDFVQAFFLGVLCNALVCLAVWLCFSARSATDKIISIIFPITAFVALGFEHCVANMYFIPVAIFMKGNAGPEFWQSIGVSAADFSHLTWTSFMTANLIPVTLGNVFGGSVLVGLIYWAIYVRK